MTVSDRPLSRQADSSPNLGEQLKCAAIRKATLLSTLCTLLLISSCTHDEITAPSNGLPQGMRAVTVDIRLPEGKPGFGEGETRATTTDGTWTQGDELLMTLSVRNINEAVPDMGDISAAAAYLTLVYDGTAWDVIVEKSYSITLLNRITSSKPYVQQPLLTDTEDLSLTGGFTLMLDEDFGEVDQCHVQVIYAPDMGIMLSDDNAVSYQLKADATTTAPEWWQTAAISDNGSLTLAWSENTGARLRVYTGAAGDVVTLASEAFSPSFQRSADNTYTATTDADGYAYFYGVMASPVTSGFTLSLTGVAVGEGDAAVTCPVSPVTLLEATDLVPVKLEAAKSYKLDASAKRPDTEKWAFFSAADITADALKSALAEGKSTIYVSGEVTDALKTAINAQAYGSIDLLVLTDATEIGNNAFYDCIALTSVELPAATSIGNNAFQYCDALTSVSLPAATSIGSYAFYNCAALTSVSLPSVTSIGNNAFYDCDALASVLLPSATSIGSYAFSGCAALTSVSLPTATEIGDNAFYSCNALESVSAPLVTEIGDYAFYNCNSLTSMTLPAATSIGLGAFQSCDNLTTLTFGAVITEVGTNAFSGVPTKNCALTLAAGQESHETYPADVENKTWAGMTWASITLE